MLPLSLDHSGYVFVTDDSQGFYIGLLSKLPAVFEAPYRVLWVMRFADHSEMVAGYRWFAVRRASWVTWAKIAETDGPQALGKLILALMRKEPIGEATGCSVNLCADGYAVEFSELVDYAAGQRKELLYVHRFATTGSRERFMEWFCDHLHRGAGETLIDMAVNEGVPKLAEILDQIGEGRLEVDVTFPA